MSKPDLVPQIQQHSWFHSIDLGEGLMTDGASDPVTIMDLPGSLPDLRGKSVLDIGAWDGKYSFLAERAGAARVVALDHYVWRLDWAARQAYYEECEAAGVLPEQEKVDYGFLVEDGTPGKAGFDLVHDYLDSHVESVVADFMTADLAQLGTFDVVQYFGVLYHMVNPIASLQRLRRVTGEVAVIETAAVVVPGYPQAPLLELYAGNELADDYGNWFAPSEAALHALCLAAGFARVETKATTPVDMSPVLRPGPGGLRPQYCRILVQAFVDPAAPSLQTEVPTAVEPDQREWTLVARDSWVGLEAKVDRLRARAKRRRARLETAEARIARKDARIERLSRRLAELDASSRPRPGVVHKLRSLRRRG